MNGISKGTWRGGLFVCGWFDVTLHCIAMEFTFDTSLLLFLKRSGDEMRRIDGISSTHSILYYMAWLDTDVVRGNIRKKFPQLVRVSLIA